MGVESTRFGLIRGSNKFNIEKLAKFEERKLDTEFGIAGLLVSDNIIVLPRHGLNNNIPPHKINHRANMQALQEVGVNKIISFTSVGSLHFDLSPMLILIPDDYITIGKIVTYFDTEIRHIIPGLDLDLREVIYNIIKNVPLKIKFNGTYIQTQGPRLETKAEINMLKSYGDVIGMTMASEATLANEIGLPYANISVVDNYCNGIVDEPLTIDKIHECQTKNTDNIEKIIELILN